MIPKNLTLLIDGDILLYRCGFAAEKQKYLVQHKDAAGNHYGHAQNAKEAKEVAEDVGGWVWTRREVEPVENALSNVDNALNGIFDALYTDVPRQVELILFLTGKGNFRDTLATKKTYKDNRDPTHRPKHYKAIREHLIRKYKAHVINGEEADDGIGRAAYERAMDKYVIVSNDKDLDQLGGWHYDWTTKTSYFVTDEEAVKNFYVQLLEGDGTDNIPGPLTKGKGRGVVEECSSPHALAAKAKEVYEKEYKDQWAEWVEEISELVWIRRHTPKPDEKFHSPFWAHYHGD